MLSVVDHDRHAGNRRPLGALRAGSIEIADVHRTRLDCDRALDGGLLAAVIGDREDDSVRAGRRVGVLLDRGSIRAVTIAEIPPVILQRPPFRIRRGGRVEGAANSVTGRDKRCHRRIIDSLHGGARRRTGARVVSDDELHGERAGSVAVRGGGDARGLVKRRSIAERPLVGRDRAVGIRRA